jgi:YD repeat-containing protein
LDSAESIAIPSRTSYTYNSVGEVLTMTDPLSKTTSNTYDVNGNLLTGRSPLGKVLST